MKKVEGGKRGPAAKANRKPKSVGEYLLSVPEPARSTLRRVRAAIRSTLPDTATETISYRIPAFKYKKILMWYAAFAEHCSLFPTASIIEMFKAELKAYTTSKGTIQFPIDKPLPARLIRKMVKARVAQVERVSGGRER